MHLTKTVRTHLMNSEFPHLLVGREYSFWCARFVMHMLLKDIVVYEIADENVNTLTCNLLSTCRMYRLCVIVSKRIW